jgi:dTDP-4-amino-4,6-dideoxygalactose transaminase
MSVTRLRAVSAREPAFSDGIPFARPELRDTALLARKLQAVLDTGMITNGTEVEALEEEFAEHVGAEHCVAVSSATSGLILAAKCMGLTGEVILPSFTFVATGLALVWNSLQAAFVDVDPHTCNIDCDLIGAAVTPRTSAIVAVHVYGNPADERALERVAARHDLRLLFDAAHGVGARYRGRPVGTAGDAQVFSLSPTKLATGGEGGLVTTNDGSLADDLRLARNYGQPSDYHCRLGGLNARLSELHAVVARHTLAYADEGATRRNQLAARYEAGLAGVPGLSFPLVHPLDRHSYKDFTLLVDAEQFGMSRDRLREALAGQGVAARAYFDPPLHRQDAIGLRMGPAALPNTERLAAQVLSPPMYSEMTFEDVDRVCETIRAIHAQEQ